MRKGDKVYYARILPQTETYEVVDCKVRMVEDTWFSCTEDREQHAFLFSNNDIGKTVFYDRLEALEKVVEAESVAPKVSGEIEYEEY